MGGIEGLWGKYQLVGCEGQCNLIGMEDLWMKLDDGDVIMWRHDGYVLLLLLSLLLLGDGVLMDFRTDLNYWGCPP